MVVMITIMQNREKIYEKRNTNITGATTTTTTTTTLINIIIIIPNNYIIYLFI